VKNWRQLHVGPIYTQNICHRHLNILPTKLLTSDKHDIDSSRLTFMISKMTTVFVLRKLQTALQVILIFNYVTFCFKLPIAVIDIHFKKENCELEIPATVAFNSRNFQVT
jgi:hypothetical protein